MSARAAAPVRDAMDHGRHRHRAGRRVGDGRRGVPGWRAPDEAAVSTATGAPDLVSLVRAHLTVGATVTSVAERLGMPADLVAAAIDALIGGGVVGGSCG